MSTQDSAEWQRKQPPRTWREKLFDFALQQGIATVLLFAFLGTCGYGFMYGLPWLVDRIEMRLTYINESHERRLNMVIAEQAEDRKLYREDRELFREEQDKSRSLNAALLQELRQLEKRQ